MNIDKDFYKKYYIIKYKDKIIASGNFKYVKNHQNKRKNALIWPDNCISLDNKYFFNTESSKFKIENINYIENYIISQEELKKYFIIELWRNCESNINADIFIEYTINQLDKQVIPLVNSINKLDNVETVGSCSGHNIFKPYIDIRFQSLSALKIFLTFLQKDEQIKNELQLQSSHTIKNTQINGVVFHLTTIKKISIQAYQLFDKFAELINSRI